MLESLRINGQFFNLKTDLVYSSESGFKPINSVICRNHPLQDDCFISTYDVDITSKQRNKSQIIYSNNSKSVDEIGNPVNEINKLLSMKIAIIEFNFDRINILLNNQVFTITIDAHDMIEDKVLRKSLEKLGVKRDNLINSILFNPIIPQSENDIIIQDIIINKYLLQIRSIILLKEVDFIVFTGERIWTNCLDDLNINNILNNIINKNIYFCIDRNGLWESVLHNSIDDRFNKSISRKSLAPNAYYYIPKKKSEQIFAFREESKRTLLLDEGITIFDNLDGYVFKDLLLPEKLFVKGRSNIKKNIQFKSKYNINHDQMDSKSFSVGYDSLVNIYDNKLDLSIEKGSEIKIGMKIGEGIIKNRKIINMNDINSRFKLHVNHGENINKGEVLGANETIYGKIMGEILTSPYSGVVDLHHIDKGYIFINDHKNIKYDYLSTFNGRLIKSKYKETYQIRSDYYRIPLKISTNSISGKLVNHIEDVDLQTKILLVKDVHKIDYTAEELINNNVVALLFTHLSYEDFDFLLKKKTIFIDLFSINVIDAFGKEDNQVIVDIMNKYNNYYISIEKNQLFILTDVQKQSDDSMQNLSKSTSGKAIQLLSYTSKLMYYRIMKKKSESTYLIGNDDGMVESDVSNILF